MRRANDDAMQRVWRDEIGDITPASPYEALVSSRLTLRPRSGSVMETVWNPAAEKSIGSPVGTPANRYDQRRVSCNSIRASLCRTRSRSPLWAPRRIASAGPERGWNGPAREAKPPRHQSRLPSPRSPQAEGRIGKILHDSCDQRGAAASMLGSEGAIGSRSEFAVSIPGTPLHNFPETELFLDSEQNRRS